MKTKSLITISVLLTCGMFIFSLANISKQTSVSTDYDAVIYEQTGLDVKDCRLHLCMYPVSDVTRCISDAGPVFVTRHKNEFTVKFGEPYLPLV